MADFIDAYASDVALDTPEMVALSATVAICQYDCDLTSISQGTAFMTSADAAETSSTEMAAAPSIYTFFPDGSATPTTFVVLVSSVNSLALGITVSSTMDAATPATISWVLNTTPTSDIATLASLTDAPVATDSSTGPDAQDLADDADGAALRSADYIPLILLGPILLVCAVALALAVRARRLRQRERAAQEVLFESDTA